MTRAQASRSKASEAVEVVILLCIIRQSDPGKSAVQQSQEKRRTITTLSRLFNDSIAAGRVRKIGPARCKARGSRAARPKNDYLTRRLVLGA